MKLKEDFMFLKSEEKIMKSDKGNKYLIVDMLDKDRNACKFFIFNPIVQDKFRELNLSDMQLLTLELDLVFNQNWRLNVVDVSE